MAAKCSIRVSADGAVCGEPAVFEFASRHGEDFAECAAHHVVSAPVAPEVAEGVRVEVQHGGIAKIGRVVSVGRSIARVEIPVVRRPGAVKVIERPIAEIRVAR